MEFRLLAETTDPSDRPFIILENRRWSLTEPFDIRSQSGIPPYVCISYVWGEGRVPNPIHPTIKMSDHTLPAITAAIRNQDSKHPASMFWIDAFCVPTEPQAKRATLESMGFIYSNATHVVVVLCDQSFAAIQYTNQLETAKKADAARECLDVLERDSWIRSVWTYQEVVNSRELLITGEGMTGTFILGGHFLNHFGQYLITWRRDNGHSAFAFHERYPFLDAFENVTLDWRVSAFTERSALQVMSQMHIRRWVERANIIYSMIGVITSEPSQRKSGASMEALVDTFLTLCEEKGDYSFIYASTKRDERPQYRWRPALEVPRSVLPWPSHGEAQRGERDLQGIRLKDMAVLETSASVVAEGKEYILDQMGFSDEVEGLSDAALADKVHTSLQQVGFTGSKEYIGTTHGFFFPQWPIAAPEALVALWVSTSIDWRIATPGMAIVLVKGQRRYIPGVFAGLVPGKGTEVFIHFQENSSSPSRSTHISAVIVQAPLYIIRQALYGLKWLYLYFCRRQR